MPLCRLVAASLAIAGCSRSVSVTTGAARDRPVVRILSVNDVYVADTLRDGTGGLARVAAVRDSLARLGPVVFMLAGDVVAPSLLTKWYGGAQMIDAFNAARLDFATFGNHEFDISQAQLEARLAQSKFRWLSTNCTRADGTPFPGTRGWDTVRVNGTLLGVVGATIVTRYPRWVSCRPALPAVRAAVDTLQQRGAQLIVGLTHLSVREDSALLASEPRLTAILGGHEHTEQRVALGSRVVRKADSDARTAVVMSIVRDGEGGLGGWRAVDQLVALGRGAPEDAATALVVSRWRDSLVQHLGPGRVLATSAEALDVRDGTGRNGEGQFGDLVTDAMRAGTHADVALLNGGAMRLDDMIPSGPITNHQLESVFLFSDETRVVTFTLTGAELRAQLTHAVTSQVGLGGYPQVSGIRFGYDGRLPPASRQVLNLTSDDGRPIADDQRLSVSAVGYMACNGGDGYTMVEASRSACANLATAPRTVDLLMTYVAAMPGGRLTLPQVGRVTVTH